MRYLILFIVLLSCSRARYLATKPHTFSHSPKRVFIFQIAGFDIHHIGLLKFSDWEKLSDFEFENFQCQGSLWNYNLFSLRPDAFEQMNAQVTGKLHNFNKCESYKDQPFWKILESKKYHSLIVEAGANEKESLLKTTSCSESTWLKDTLYMKRDPNLNTSKELKTYYMSNKAMLGNGFYRDSSCGDDVCFQSLEKFLKSIKDRWIHGGNKFNFVYRDFQYLSFLKKREFKKAASRLKDISKAITYLKKSFGESNNLFLISSSSPVKLDFPYQGRDWGKLEKTMRTLKPNLLSPVLAMGARSENFCGIYNSSEIFQRIFFGKKKYKLLR